jgi:copper(I)-binding protein
MKFISPTLRIRRAWHPLLLLVSVAAVAAQPRSVTVDELTIASAWARATTSGATTGAAYFTVENRGRQLDTLLRATSPVATEVTFLRAAQHEGVSRTDVVWSVDITPGRTLKFDPNGRYVMLSGLKQPLVAGTHFPVTLNFQHAGDVVIQVEVVPAAATGPVASASPATAPADQRSR